MSYPQAHPQKVTAREADVLYRMARNRRDKALEERKDSLQWQKMMDGYLAIIQEHNQRATQDNNFAIAVDMKRHYLKQGAE